MKRSDYVQPKSLDQALEAAKEAAFKAGGVDLPGLVKDRLAEPVRIVNLLALAELRAIRSESGVLRIGALATLAEVAAHEGLRQAHPALHEAAANAATPHIRNQATLGGNLLQRPRCWYFRNPDLTCLKRGGSTCFAQEGDSRFHAVFSNDLCGSVHPSSLAPPLVALEASVVLKAPGGVERVLPLEAFLTAPDRDVTRENALQAGELLAEVRVPEREWSSAYLEARERSLFDWPLASVAVALRAAGGKVSQARVIAGGVAPVPWRLTDVESAVIGSSLDEAAVTAASEASGRRARVLRDNSYKLPLLRTLVARALRGAAEADWACIRPRLIVR